MPTDTNIQNLVINKLTSAQYSTATKSPTELYLITDDDTYVTKSNVTSTYSSSGTDPVNGTAVAQAISGLDSNVVHKSGDETIGGDKTVTGLTRFNNSTTRVADWVANTTPSEHKYCDIQYRDSTDVWFGTTGIMKKTDGSLVTRVQSRKFDGSNNYATLEVGWDVNGNVITYAPTPTDTLDNSSRIATTAWKYRSDNAQRTNCLITIPYDINFTLTTAGTLTLKSGSKLYKPNGSGVFDTYTTQNDVTYGYSSGISTRIVFYNLTTNTMQSVTPSQCYSGTTAPTGSGTIFWYDTTNNKVKRSTDGGSTWDSNEFSLPICIINVNSGIKSIETVFNGFGYIGSTIYILPGVKGIYPNGRNADGTLNKTEVTSTTVLTQTSSTSDGTGYIMMTSSNASGFVHVYYDKSRNILWNEENDQIQRVVCGTFIRGTDGKISNFKPKDCIRNVDYNDFHDIDSSVVHLAGTETISGNKTFTGGANCKNFSVYNNSLIKGTAPSSDTWWGINFYDKNGTNNENNRLARFQHCYYQNGNAVAAITVDKPEAGSTSNTAIVIHYDANGDTYATFPTPPSATDNSTKGATTSWVRNHRCTTKPSTTSTASDDAPSYIVQNYRSGKNWYLVYSDGFIEQGGYYSGNGNNKEVTLLKTMSNTNYSIMLNFNGTSGASYSGCSSATSTSKISISIPTSYSGAWWRVSGY